MDGYPLNIQKQFTYTLECLSSLGVQPVLNPPIIKIVKELGFDCSIYLNVAGCYTAYDNTVYVTEAAAQWAFSHEIIHWATGLGNDAHDDIYFQQCQYKYY